MTTNLGRLSAFPPEILSECISPYFSLSDYKKMMGAGKDIAKIVDALLARWVIKKAKPLSTVFYPPTQHTKAVEFTIRHQFKHVDLESFHDLSDEDLDQILRSPHIKSLRISATRNIINFNTSSLSLESLFFRTSKEVNIIGLSRLSTFPNLKSLELDAGFNGCLSMNPFSTLIQLSSFSFKGLIANYQIQAFFLTQLTSLSLTLENSCLLDHNGIESLSRFTNLSELIIRNTSSNPIVFEKFEHMTNLKKLDFSNYSGIHNPLLAVPYLRNLTNLEELNLSQPFGNQYASSEGPNLTWTCTHLRSLIKLNKLWIEMGRPLTAQRLKNFLDSDK